MTQTDTTREDPFPKSLVALGSYAWPQGVTQQTLTYAFEKIRDKVPFLTNDKESVGQDLHPARDQQMIDRTHDQLHDILFDCLDDGFLDWCESKNDPPRLRAFVSPPMPHDILHDWAKARGLAVIASPDDLEWTGDVETVIFPGFGGLIQRDYQNLPHTRAVLEKLAQTNKRVLVGCNSWAWRYLCAVSSVDFLIPIQHTLPAFNAEALAALIEPTFTKSHPPETVLADDSGKPVFDRAKDGDLKDDYFRRLAKRSLGLPWGAIELFYDDAQSTEDQDTSGGDTYLSDRTRVDIPDKYSQSVSIALQNLLIHEPCDQDMLTALLPEHSSRAVGMWDRLHEAGLITRTDDGTLRHVVCHYAAIRSAIGTAGLNLDRL